MLIGGQTYLSIASALELRDRAIMSNGGKAIPDLSGEPRRAMAAPGLPELFKRQAHAAPDNDRMLPNRNSGSMTCPFCLKQKGRRTKAVLKW